MQRVLSTVVLLGLLVGSAAAFALTEHLKLEKSPIYATSVTKVFSPVCHCATDKASIGFSLRHPDSITVSIVDANGHVVDTIASGVNESARAVTFPWDGHTSAGTVAADGTYQPRVDLANARRTITMPNKITLDTATPTVAFASDGAGVLFAGVNHSITIAYVLSGKAHAAVYLGSRRVLFSHSSQTNGAVKWKGTAGGKALPAGRYVLEIAAVDAAGNETPPSERKHVVVVLRTLSIVPAVVHVKPAARFSVSVLTSEPTYAWRFAGRSGTAQAILHLHAPSRPGRYTLVVTAGPYRQSSVVVVRRK